MGALQEFVDNFTHLGIFAVLLLGRLALRGRPYWGEQVLNRRLVRLVLSPVREQWPKAAHRRHALKTVLTARDVMGLRAAAFLTAGSASVPFWKFVVADAGAALFGVPLAFGLAYFFTDQIKAITVALLSHRLGST